MKFKIEYIWLDGYTPEPNLRSKTKVIEGDFISKSAEPMVNAMPVNKRRYPELEDLPIWSFDGSSTKQATGDKSDCLLKPVRLVRDTQREGSYLAMCEVLNADSTPHKSNTRALYDDEDKDFWFGFEQEYTLMGKNKRPLGFPNNGYPAPQGMYYCSVGHGNVNGRDIVEEHFDACLGAGLDITGINAEVMLGQWEYQVLGKGAKKASDDLWLSRYLLYRITEARGLRVEFHPKPEKGDWNGSGCHANFSNTKMREEGGEQYFKDVCEAFRPEHDKHIKEYGSSNDERLTGEHETQSIKEFSYDVSDRGASIRIPVAVPADGWKGYLEDRRPASNCDPYKVTKRILQTVKSVG